MPDIQGRANSLMAYMIPCVRFVDLVHQPEADSAIDATLGRGGWLNLTPQGLAPCKKRQASLGALTLLILTILSCRTAINRPIFAYQVLERLIGESAKDIHFILTENDGVHD